MGFCKICTGRKKPGIHVKIVVNLKKDNVCQACNKHFEVKSAKRKGHKKLVIFISRLSYSVKPSRHGGASRLLLPISRESNDSKKEVGWVDIEIDRGSDMDCIRSISRTHFNMDVGNTVPYSRRLGNI